MGLLTKGQINVSVLRLQVGDAELNNLAETAQRYQTSDKPSVGWGQLSDDPAQAQRASLRTSFTSVVPTTTANQHGTKTLPMRLYYEEPNTRLRKLFGEIADRREYTERFGVDVLLLDQNEPGALTALVSTTKSNDIKYHVKPALEALVPDGSTGTGLVTDYANTDELDPDIFLWLFFKDAEDRRISPEIKLSGIANMDCRSGPIWRSRLYRGASVDRAEIKTLIGLGNNIFGPSRFSFFHSASPQGFFDINLNTNLGYSVLRTSEYDEEDLKQLPEAEVGPRMAQDVWQVFIPAIRRAHQNDKLWHASKRVEFINQCRAAIHKLSEPLPVPDAKT
ncbi:hypothetical protein [Mycolicibacterium neoaurum]|uniref:hypothetical protein n=1 Tax=Mycolicibacterium neoaurum TaxID=1795 RepID=UPI001F4CE847|nr:hypothetical protein [Mycolicibacterium neoaurum]